MEIFTWFSVFIALECISIKIGRISICTVLFPAPWCSYRARLEGCHYWHTLLIIYHLWPQRERGFNNIISTHKQSFQPCGNLSLYKTWNTSWNDNQVPVDLWQLNVDSWHLAFGCWQFVVDTTVDSWHFAFDIWQLTVTCVAPAVPSHTVDPAVTEELPADAVPTPGLAHVNSATWKVCSWQLTFEN